MTKKSLRKKQKNIYLVNMNHKPILTIAQEGLASLDRAEQHLQRAKEVLSAIENTFSPDKNDN